MQRRLQNIGDFFKGIEINMEALRNAPLWYKTGFSCV